MDNKLDHIHLIGNSQESFYNLGQMDKSSFPEVSNQISKLCARNNVLAKIIKTTAALGNKLIYKKRISSLDELKAYSEGLERPLDDVLFTMLIPEVVSSFNKWSPNLLSLIPGCSSLFTPDHTNQGVIHSRILDYSLSGVFEKNERCVTYELDNTYKIFSYTTAGMPLPSLSAMNEKGLTLALHYKHGDVFDLEGESIFQLSFDILKSCSTIREALKFLKGKKSISYWGIYLSDSSGEVVSIDICGKEMYQEKYDLFDHEYLYFNNSPILKHKSFGKLQPFGRDNHCLMRKKSLDKSMISSFNPKAENLTYESLSALANIKVHKSNSAKNWNLSPITASSLQLFSFHNKKFESCFTLGDAPKNIINNTVHFKEIFSNLKQKNIIAEKEKSLFYFHKAHRFLAKYQAAIDIGDTSTAYHNIQMACELYKGYPEFFIARFYFLCTQYIFETDKRELAYLLTDFQELETKLPQYLDDHRQLFILRLKRILKLKTSKEEYKIRNENLKELFTKEYKLNSFTIKNLRHLIFPRLEILDIIYAY